LDGSQHYEKEGKEYDKKRDEYLSFYGITVLRFSNSEFLSNQNGVLCFVQEKTEEQKSKSPSP
jgi:very-short-patch-repair endonuclease